MTTALYTIAPYALIDSVNLLLIGVILLSRLYRSLRDKIRWISLSILFGDLAGIMMAGMVALSVVRYTDLDPQGILNSPFFGYSLIAVGLLGLSAVKSKRLASSVSRSVQFVGKRRLNSILFSVTVGAVQSLTSIPFWGGILEIEAFPEGTLNPFALLALYSLMATFAVALVTLYSLVAKSKGAVSASRVISWGTLASSLALVGLGILKL